MLPHSHQETSPELAGALRALRRTGMYLLGFSFAMNLLALMLPIYSLQVFDRVFTTRSMDTLLGLTAIVLFAYAFFGALYAVRAGIIAKIVEWLDHHLAITILAASVRAASLYPRFSGGQQLRELGVIKGFIAGAGPNILDVPWSILFIAMIYMIHPVLGVISILSVLTFLALGLLNEYSTKKALLRANEKSLESQVHADSLSLNAEAIQAMGMMQGALASWRVEYAKSLDWQDLAQQRSALLQGLTRSLRMVMQIAIIGVGAYLALNKELTAGGLIASSILIGRALAPFENFIMVWKQYTAARESYMRLSRMLRDAPPILGDTQLPVPQGAVSVEGLYYSPQGRAPILKGITFRLNPGESIGIIGPSAAGKSTLAKCLVGILPPSHGHVRLDGADVYSWAREDFGRYAGYLPQQVELFPGTIKQNIARMQEHASDAAVIEACARAGVHELILKLPQGYDTLFTPGITVLSPGQKQRLGLARALYGNPRYLVLDEPNNNLDGEGERALQQVIANVKQQGTTLVVVAHRPSILNAVDTILMLRAGTIEAAGSREQMMQRYAQPIRPMATEQAGHA